MTRTLASCWHSATLVAVCALLVTQTAGAQDGPASPFTPEHELLKKDVGTWDTTITVWPGPGAEPIVSHGRETSELLPGGLWLVTRFEGEMAGVPTVGSGTWGYDPAEKKYVGIWVDSNSPHPTIIRGVHDPETKTTTSTAEGRDLKSGQATCCKLITQYTDDGKRQCDIYASGPDGQSWKVMEFQYKRATE